MSTTPTASPDEYAYRQLKAYAHQIAEVLDTDTVHIVVTHKADVHGDVTPIAFGLGNKLTRASALREAMLDVLSDFGPFSADPDEDPDFDQD